MKCMFVGGRLHAHVLEIPKGDDRYTTTILTHDTGKVVKLEYRADAHAQLFRLVAYNGKPVANLPIDFYTTNKVRRWIELISRTTQSTKMKAPPPST